MTLVALLVQRAGGQRPGGQQVGWQQIGDSAWEAALGQPEDARIGGVAAVEGAVAVWVMRPDGDRVVLVDPRRGRVAGEIRLR